MNSIETSKDLHSELAFKVKARFNQINKKRYQGIPFEQMNFSELKSIDLHLDDYDKAVEKINFFQWESENLKKMLYKFYGQKELFRLSHEQLKDFLQNCESELGNKSADTYSKYQPGDKVLVSGNKIPAPWRWRNVTAVSGDLLCVKGPIESESYWVLPSQLEYWSPESRCQDNSGLTLFFYHPTYWETTVGFGAVALGKAGMLIKLCQECSGSLLVTDIDRTPNDKSPKEQWKHARHVERLCDRIGRLLVQI